MTEQKRLNELDIAKGLGMLTVIWAHIMDVGYTHILIYAFHMPLFFFISGMVFDRQRYSSFGVFIKKRFKSLIIPYLIFSVITWFIWVAYNIISKGQVESYIFPLIQTFIAQGSQGYLVHNVPLWFVSCLLVIEIIYYFISKLNMIKIILISAFLAIVSYLFEVWNGYFDFTKLPWNMGVAFACVAFYACGNQIMIKGQYRKLTNTIGKHGAAFIGILFVLTIVLSFTSLYNGRLTIGHEQYGNNRVLFYINAFMGIACVLIFSNLLDKFGNRLIFLNKIVDGCKWIGKNCIYFMLIENPIKGFVVIVVSKVVGVSDAVVRANFGYSFISFVISLVVTIVSVRIILIIKKHIKKKNKSVV